MTAFWFIDDLRAINNWGQFARSCKEICLPELEFKNENILRDPFLIWVSKLNFKKMILNCRIRVITSKFQYFASSLIVQLSATLYK